jgi:hypothetical protein
MIPVKKDSMARREDIALAKAKDASSIRAEESAYVALLTGKDIICDQRIEDLKSDGT